MKIRTFVLVICIQMAFLNGCQKKDSYDMSEAGFKDFINDFVKQAEPLNTRYNQVQWDAYITGKAELFDQSARLSLQIDSIYQDESHYKYLKTLKDSGIINDSLLNRQLGILYKSFLAKQISPGLNEQITGLAAKLENTFGNFRADVDGKKLSDNEITNILKKSTDSKYREKVWRAQKKLGDLAAGDIVSLARLRNQSAGALGYDNFYTMQMDLSDLDPRMVETTFDELYQLSQQPYREIQDRIESIFAERYGIRKEDIRPWHYEHLFAQEAPAVFDINLDSYFKDIDIPAKASDYYASFNMEVTDIVQRSDLYEKEGKNQHAYSFNIDRKQDIRILCNIVPNLRWMETMLHELGHAIYDKYIDPSLPWLLRDAANQLTTEGIAMLFGGFASNVSWMKQALSLSDQEVAAIRHTVEQNARFSKLIFARWSMVVFNFERLMYGNPEQDLNRLWWDLVEKYQLIKRPDKAVGNEWATKIHIANYPVYYQNYQLGELFASQVLNYVATNFYKDADLNEATFWDNEKAGSYLIEQVFRPAKKWPWNTMIRNATREPLQAKYFVEQYVK